jgi:metal-dependent amidase/aminoacylase/carboxypeptidase family protein
VNVISENVYIGGSIRTFEDETLKLVLSKVR